MVIFLSHLVLEWTCHHRMILHHVTFSLTDGHSEAASQLSAQLRSKGEVDHAVFCHSFFWTSIPSSARIYASIMALIFQRSFLPTRMVLGWVNTFYLHVTFLYSKMYITHSIKIITPSQQDLLNVPHLLCFIIAVFSDVLLKF